ncbi:MAG: DNA polymerase I [Acholeplasmatales bacterium]|nr:DNA polymerase I [Acholeplasmatales bacterium]
MKRLILVDGNSLMYRAYYGMSAGGTPTANSKGLFTNAIYGFARMMNSLIMNPYDAILVAFDAGKKTFRHDMMKDYKAGRAPMPDEFRMQISYIKEFLDIMRIKRWEQDLYEADDIIGTMAKKASDLGYHVDIYSSDKDLLQLISENTTVHMTKKGFSELEDFTPEHFLEVYGIPYTSWVDLKALMGDKSDNLAGVPGIGEKTGVKLLNTYGSLEGIISHKDEIKGSVGEKIRANVDSALLCQKMATILRDFPIGVSIDELDRKEMDKDRLIEFYTELEFKSLLKELTFDAPKIEQNKIEYKAITNGSDLSDILEDNSAMIFETFEYNYHKSPLLAIGIKNSKGTFVVDPNIIFNSMDFMMFLSDKKNHKAIFDYKRAYVLSKRLGLELLGVDFDLLLATYILNPSAAKEEFKGIADFYGISDCYYDEAIYGKGAKKFIPEKNVIYSHVAKKVNTLYALKCEAIERLKEKDQYHLLTEIEIPLSRVLGKMEFQGMMVDKEELNRQEYALNQDINILVEKIYTLANHEFNISSPKQLGTVLFDELGLPYPKKKGQSYSTDIEVLEAIREANPIVPLIIEYRAKTKLMSTYVSGLREMIYPDDKVHTIYQQALTQTGRLSSIEPNLQNIPIRTEEGHKIRRMFIPSNPKNSLYSSDYSQVELRVLAHMANVGKLKEAFLNGEDIHTRTAQEVFGTKDVTPEERRRAKAVNFGIVYGISAFGLAQDLHISNVMAQDFIKKYYEAYPEIKTFMDETIEFCKNNGYVKTMKNRIRYIPDINSKIYMQREFAKRTAMNAPIQGSAADIIKIAMVKIDNELEEMGLRSKMLVQVHDELVFEVEAGEEDTLKELVERNMENAVKLDVPLIVDDSFGKNWYEVK